MMVSTARAAFGATRSFFRSEAGQDVFEYVLIIGIIVVAVLIAVATPVGTSLINAVVSATCNAVDKLGPGSDFIVASCP